MFWGLGRRFVFSKVKISFSEGGGGGRKNFFGGVGAERKKCFCEGGGLCEKKMFLRFGKFWDRGC